MGKILRASIIYKCPETNQIINENLWAYSRDNYNGEDCDIRIYKCKSCGEEHEIELN